MDSGFSQEPPEVWVMLEGHEGPQVPVGHHGVLSLSPLQECSHLSRVPPKEGEEGISPRGVLLLLHCVGGKLQGSPALAAFWEL